MRATRELPPGYQARARLHLSENRVMAIVLNVLGLLLLIPFAGLFSWLAGRMRPAFLENGLLVFGMVEIATVLVAAFGVIVLHEAVHGLFFWLYTRSRPTFGYKVIYAYAAAPGWYLPRNQYILVGLAPLLLISLAGLAAIPFLPMRLLPALVIGLILNASGAVGDMAVVAWVLTYSPRALIHDEGDGFTLYAPDS